FKKIYRPTNNNLRTSSNSRNRNVDTTLRFKNDNQSRQFGNQRTVNIAGARENIGSPVVQQSGIQCFNCKEFGHFAKECRKPKRVKDSVYQKEKMLMYKQAEQGVPLQAEQYDWLADTDEEIQKQLKKANTTLAQELKECKTILVETSKSLGESISVRDSCLVALQTKQVEFEKYKAFNDHTIDYEKLKRRLNETLGQLALKDIEIKEGLKTKAYEISVVKEKHDELIKQSLLTKSHYEEREQYFEIQDLKAQLQDKNIAISELKKLIEKGKGKSVDTKFVKPSVVRQPNAQRIPKPSVLGKPAHFSNSLERMYFPKTKSVPKTNVSEGLSIPVTAQTLPQTAGKAVSNINVLKPGMYRINNRSTQTRAPQLPQTVMNTNPRVSASTGVNHRPNVSRPQLKSNQSRDKVLPNNSQVKGNNLLTGNRGSDLYTIFLQESTSSTPLCLMAKASPIQAWLWHRRLYHLNFDYINLLLKKDIVIGLPKLKYVKDQLCSSCELSKAKDGENLDKMKEKGDQCILVGYFTRLKGYRVYNKRTKMIVQSIHIRFDEIKEVSETSVANDTSCLVPQRQKASNYDNSNPIPQLQNVSSSVDAHIPSQQELDLLFGHLYDEFFNADDEFTNPFCTTVQEVAESSSHHIGNSNVPTFNQPHVYEYRWMKDHPLEQVRRNPSRPVQTRRQLATDPEMCMFALTVSTAEPKNIKEAMADSAWIEAMQ
nr:integrase, catalytic region, zinc finger, CCHC-type, peptidase aspartic, catalytic [Tanacetum cinerariifolium]